MTAENTPKQEQDVLIALTADIICAYISHNACPSAELAPLISSVYEALDKVNTRTQPESQQQKPAIIEKLKPAVNPKNSLMDDYIICLEDGKQYKSLKRHLMTHYNMTPEQYREKWGLDHDYPMVAPNYAKERARLAKKMGLGRKNSVRDSKK